MVRVRGPGFVPHVLIHLPTTGDEGQPGFDDHDYATLGPSLQIPKNRSTGNLASIAETSDSLLNRSRIRFSFDASAAAAEHDSVARLASLVGRAVVFCSRLADAQLLGLLSAALRVGVALTLFSVQKCRHLRS